MTDSGTSPNLHEESKPTFVGARRRRPSMTAQPPGSEPETTSGTAETPPEAPLSATTPPSAAEEVSFAESTGAPSRRRIGLVVGGAILLVVAAAATSMAASPAPSASPNAGQNTAPGGDRGLDAPFGFDHGRLGRPGFANITIASISGNDVTLATADGWRRTVTVASSMNITKGGQDIAVGDLKVGDQVRFRQTRNADGTYTVTDLAVVVPTIRGTASAVTSSGFKVTTRDGSVWTVTVNGSTKYAFGKGDGALSDVKDGTTVVVSGETTGENAITALGVRVAPDRAVGTVTAKTADSITIKRRDGSSLTIHVSGDTTFRVAGNASAKLSDVAVDMAIGVSGRARSDGSIDADAVVAGNVRGLRGDGKWPRLDAPGLFLPGLDGPATDSGSDSPSG
jgi:hypothetical protein